MGLSMTDTELKASIVRSLNSRIDLFGDLVTEEMEASFVFGPLAEVIAPRVPYFLRPILADAEDGIDEEEFQKHSEALRDKVLEGIKTEVPGYAWALMSDRLTKIAEIAAGIIMGFARKGASFGLED